MITKITKQLGKLLIITSLILLFNVGETNAARLYLEPETKEFNTNCEGVLNLKIDTEGEFSKGVDSIIYYNPSEIEIIDQDPYIDGIQIRNGIGVYDFYPYNQVYPEQGKIYLAGASMFSEYKTGASPGTYGVIILKSKPGTTSTELYYDFTAGDTTDSNVAAVDSSDLLTSVGNGIYTFVDLGFCGVDSSPPAITNEDPSAGSTGNSLDSTISFDISDTLSGVDIDTIVVNINGVEYTNGDPEFSFTGDQSSYHITVNPATDFLPDEPIFVEIEGSDQGGNIMQPYIYSFNHPEIDETSPYITNPDPSPGNKGVPLDSNVTFHVKDDLSGIDINSIVVVVDGTSYSFGDPGFSFSGNPNDYFITIDPVTDFPADTPITVTIDATDTKGNIMSPYSYTFNQPAVCGDFLVELEEECEPPNSGICDENCLAIACPIIPEEPTEPPPEDTTLLGGFLQLSDPDQQEQIILAKDSDGDGIPDSTEQLYQTDPENSDSDGDGYTDGEEILDYGTDPNDPNDIPGSGTKITNLKEGDTTSSDQLFIKGTSEANQVVRIYATEVLEDGSKGHKTFLGETTSTDDNKFAILSEIPLEEGTYFLEATSYNSEGQIIDKSEPIRVTIDFSLVIEPPVIESISDVPVVRDVRLVIYDEQPVVFGISDPGTQVFVYFESSILSSTILSDTQTGFFTVFAPRPMPLGEHKVTLYAVGSSGVISKSVTVDFMIREKGIAALRETCWWCILVIIAVIITLTYIYYRYKKKKKEDEEKKALKEKTEDSVQRAKKAEEAAKKPQASPSKTDQPPK